MTAIKDPHPGVTAGEKNLFFTCNTVLSYRPQGHTRVQILPDGSCDFKDSPDGQSQSHGFYWPFEVLVTINDSHS